MESPSHKGGDVQMSPLSSDPDNRCILLPVTVVIVLQLCIALRRNPYLSIIQNRTRTFWHNISADEQHVDLSKDPTKRTEEPVRLAVLLMTSHSCLVNQIVLFLGEGGPKDLHTLIPAHSFKSV